MWLDEFLQAQTDILTDIVWWVIKALLGVVNVLLGPIIQSSVDALDLNPPVTLAFFAPYFGVMNAWLPLDWAALCWSTYSSVRIALVGWRHIWKAIPTTG